MDLLDFFEGVPAADPVLCALLQLTRKNLWLTCCRSDFASGVSVCLLAKGVEIHLLLCDFAHPMPQCVDTQRALWVLLGAPGAEGLRVRLARPRHGAFQVLRSKTWCADGEVYYGGSFDFSGSRSSPGCNLVVIRDLPIVRTREAYFRTLWNEAYGQVAKKVLAEHRSRFREIWYPTDGPLADPGGLPVAFGDGHPDRQF